MEVSNKAGPSCRRRRQTFKLLVIFLSMATTLEAKITFKCSYVNGSSIASDEERQYTSVHSQCNSSQCICLDTSTCVHYSINSLGTTSYYCGMCGTLGSICSDNATCDPPGVCRSDNFCHCDRGEVREEVCVFYQATATSRGTVILIVSLLCILIVNKLISSRKAVGRFLCRTCGVCGCFRHSRCCQRISEEDESIQLCNPEGASKSAAYTISAREFIATSEDPDLDWALELSQQLTRAGDIYERQPSSFSSEESLILLPERVRYVPSLRGKYSVNPDKKNAGEMADCSSNTFCSSSVTNSSPFNPDTFSSYASSSYNSIPSSSIVIEHEVCNFHIDSLNETKGGGGEARLSLDGNASTSPPSSSSSSLTNSFNSSSECSSTRTAHLQTPPSLLDILRTYSIPSNGGTQSTSKHFGPPCDESDTALSRGRRRRRSNTSTSTSSASDSCFTFTNSPYSSSSSSIYSSRRSSLSRGSLGRCRSNTTNKIDEIYDPVSSLFTNKKKVDMVRREVSLPLTHLLQDSLDNFPAHLSLPSPGHEGIKEELHL